MTAPLSCQAAFFNASVTPVTGRNGPRQECALGRWGAVKAPHLPTAVNVGRLPKVRKFHEHGGFGVYLFFPIQRPVSDGVDCGGLRACDACSKPYAIRN